MNDIQEKVNQLVDFLYPHEKRALIDWTNKLHDGCSPKEAAIYYEACHVLIKSIKKRIQESP